MAAVLWCTVQTTVCHVIVEVSFALKCENNLSFSFNCEGRRKSGEKGIVGVSIICYVITFNG